MEHVPLESTNPVEPNEEKSVLSLVRRLGQFVAEKFSSAAGAPNEESPRPRKYRATHTHEELEVIEKAFGPGSALALRSIQRSSGYKVTVEKRS